MWCIENICYWWSKLKLQLILPWGISNYIIPYYNTLPSDKILWDQFIQCNFILSLFWLLPFTVSIVWINMSCSMKLLKKGLSGIPCYIPASLKSTMSWIITCIQIAAVGVQLILCGAEKWFTIAQFKGGAAIRVQLTCLLWTPSCHIHQRNFKSYFSFLRKGQGEAGVGGSSIKDLRTLFLKGQIRSTILHLHYPWYLCVPSTTQ